MLTPRTTLGRGFWAVFAASVLVCTANGASTPVLPQFVREELGGSAATVGVVVGSGSVVAMVLRPLMGVLADRHGRRRVTMGGALLSTVGLVLLALAAGVLQGTAGRVLFGLGGAAVNTAAMAWIVDSAVREERARALGLFGVSIWVGLAVGPQVGQAILHAWGFHAVWIACAALELAAVLSVAVLREPRRPRVRAGDAGSRRAAVGAVLRPGLVSAIAWAAEGVVLAFLVLHLEARGLPAEGLRGAAGVFSLFAVAVIAGRLLLGGLVDRIGARPTAATGLVLVGTGLGVLAAASSWPVAALGSALLGFGFSPMYPALAILATAGLPPEHRAAGLGLFTAFMDGGIAVGSVVGGLIAARWGEGAALAAVAVAQLGGLALLLGGPPPEPPGDRGAQALGGPEDAPPAPGGPPAPPAPAAPHGPVVP
jgi:MFS family permease